MKLFITGGAGFIGSNFIHYWLQKYPDDFIVNYDSLTYAGNLENLKDIETNPQYSFVKGTICDESQVSEAMDGCDLVVHFAAESHVDRSIIDATPFVKTNVEGTLILLQVSHKLKIKRFHHISTDEVFGSLDLHSKEKFNDNSKYDPRSPYAASKAGSDHLVRAFHETYGLPITISNCSNNFGPYMFPEKLFPLAITNILEGKRVPIYGDGLNVRDWLYVEDHCRAIDIILHKGTIGETYLVGGQTEDISNLEVIKKIIKIMGGNEDIIEYVKDRPGHDRRYAIDWSRMKNDFEWEPTHDFTTSLHKTIKWYTNNQTWWKHVKSGEYQNYYKQQYG
ncbi:MAG: dTDP-glucose 4,6-dehydratase [Candidatus Roizmanbacteria bacterium]